MLLIGLCATYQISEQTLGFTFAITPEALAARIAEIQRLPCGEAFMSEHIATSSPILNLQNARPIQCIPSFIQFLQGRDKNQQPIPPTSE